jgi:hypothetical protein
MARITSTSTTGYSTLALRNTGASGRTYGITVGGSGTGAATSGNLVISDDTASAIRLTLDSSGNVGVGLTPSAWNSNYKALQIGLAGAVFNDNFNEAFNVSSNAYYDSVDSRYEFIRTGYAQRYTQTNGGQHQWHTSTTSGSANTAITFTQAMTLDASGNLLVGKTSLGDSNVGVQLMPTAGLSMSLASQIDAQTTCAVYSTTAAAYRFYIGMGGTVFATNTTISAISDARLKENVQDIDVGLSAILSLKPRKFDWKEGKGKNIKGDRGFIAQEFEQVFPQLVDEWKDPAPEGEVAYKSVRQDLIPVLVKAIQELTARVQTLEAK